MSQHATPPPRVLLSVPSGAANSLWRYAAYASRVKAFGAQFDSVTRAWWIARRDAEANPGIHPFVTDKPLAKRLKQADALMQRHGRTVDRAGRTGGTRRTKPAVKPSAAPPARARAAPAPSVPPAAP